MICRVCTLQSNLTDERINLGWFVTCLCRHTRPQLQIFDLTIYVNFYLLRRRVTPDIGRSAAGGLLRRLGSKRRL